MGAAVLEVHDLRVSLAKGEALVDGISLQIGSGEVLGLVGESGSGKTMTAMAIADLAPPAVRVSAKRLVFEDSDLLTATRRERRQLLGQGMGVVFQDPLQSLTPQMRIGSQIAEPAQVHRGLNRREAAVLARERMNDVRIPEPSRSARRYPHEFSGGMRQRAMLAMALINNPRLLIADEPTTALDVTIQAQVLAVLREANREDGTAILLISHDIGVVQEVASRVAIMYAGRIVEELATNDLLTGAKHPYTQALVHSVPRLDTPRGLPLEGIPGTPPPPEPVRIGCPYEERCPLRVERCTTELPALRRVAAAHYAACHRLKVDVQDGGDD